VNENIDNLLYLLKGIALGFQLGIVFWFFVEDRIRSRRSRGE